AVQRLSRRGAAVRLALHACAWRRSARPLPGVLLAPLLRFVRAFDEAALAVLGNEPLSAHGRKLRMEHAIAKAFASRGRMRRTWSDDAHARLVLDRPGAGRIAGLRVRLSGKRRRDVARVPH